MSTAGRASNKSYEACEVTSSSRWHLTETTQTQSTEDQTPEQIPIAELAECRIFSDRGHKKDIVLSFAIPGSPDKDKRKWIDLQSQGLLNTSESGNESERQKTALQFSQRLKEELEATKEDWLTKCQASNSVWSFENCVHQGAQKLSKEPEFENIAHEMMSLKDLDDM